MNKQNLLMGSLITLFILSISLSFVKGPGVVSTRSGGTGFSTSDDGIGLITISGPIMVVDEMDMGYRSSAGALIKQLKAMEDDERVKALVLRINSPGGTVGASQEVFQELMRVKRARSIPVIASVGDIGASGAYWVAMGSDQIFANGGSLVGSIGVIISQFNLTGLSEKIGVAQHAITSGPYKDILSSWRDMRVDEKDLLQSVVDDVHAQFVDQFILSRKLTRKEAIDLADGRIFTGRQAQKIGLVDELGSLNDAIASAKALANIQGEPQIIKKTKTQFQDVINAFRGQVKSLFSFNKLSNFADVKVH